MKNGGVPAHSPVSGKVVSIGLVRTASGVEDQAIFIEPDGEDALDESCVPVDNVFSRSPEEIIRIIRDAGIVGMGGGRSFQPILSFRCLRALMWILCF